VLGAHRGSLRFARGLHFLVRLVRLVRVVLSECAHEIKGPYHAFGAVLSEQVYPFVKDTVYLVGTAVPFRIRAAPTVALAFKRAVVGRGQFRHSE
jgi:hypothetical protein